MKIEKNSMYSLTVFSYIDFFCNTLLYFGNLKKKKKKKLYEQFMNKLLVTFYTFGTNICFERGWMGGGGI